MSDFALHTGRHDGVNFLGWFRHIGVALSKTRASDRCRGDIACMIDRDISRFRAKAGDSRF